MAQSRISDRWLAVGLVAVAFFSACFITWQQREGQRLDALVHKLRDNEKETRKKKDRLNLVQGWSQEKTEDDISLEHLTALTQSPDWEIREAATAIVLHRFAANPECLADLRSRLKNTNGDGVPNDSDEKAQLELLRDIAHDRFDLYIPISRNATMLDQGRARRATGDIMASPILEDAAQTARRTVELVGEIARGVHVLSPDDSPVFSPDLAAFNGGGILEETEETPTSDPEESMALLGELPMDERNADWNQPSTTETAAERRRQRRQAMVIGNQEDGLELYDPGSVDDMQQTTQGLIQSVRGLEGQLQGLLDTLGQIEARNEANPR